MVNDIYGISWWMISMIWWLVGGWCFEPLWKIWVSWVDEIPNWKNKPLMFQSPPTSNEFSPEICLFFKLHPWQWCKYHIRGYSYWAFGALILKTALTVLGETTKPALWRLSRHQIAAKNPAVMDLVQINSTINYHLWIEVPKTFT